MLIPIQVQKVKRGSDTGVEVIVKATTQKRGLSTKSKKQIAVFFPKISVTGVKDIDAVFCRDEISEEFKSFLNRRVPLFAPLLTKEKVMRAIAEGKTQAETNLDILAKTPNILPAPSSTFGYIFVEGIGPDGTKYYSKIKCSKEEYLKLLQEEGELSTQKKRKHQQERLEYLNKVGRYEEAAYIYEELGMLEKARGMRQKAREATVVTVDLNKLIEQLGERGFTITYHCSSCGGPLKIDGETNAQAIKFCGYCGARIETIDLNCFIKSKLS